MEYEVIQEVVSEFGGEIPAWVAKVLNSAAMVTILGWFTKYISDRKEKSDSQKMERIEESVSRVCEGMGKLNCSVETLMSERIESKNIKKAIEQFRKIKLHLVEEIEDRKMRECARDVSTYFINKLEYMLERYEMDVNSLRTVIHDFRNVFQYAQCMYTKSLGIDKAEEISEKSEANRNEFIGKIEDILTSVSNNYKQNVIEAAFEYFKLGLRNLIVVSGQWTIDN